MLSDDAFTEYNKYSSRSNIKLNRCVDNLCQSRSHCVDPSYTIIYRINRYDCAKNSTWLTLDNMILSIRLAQNFGVSNQR